MFKTIMHDATFIKNVVTVLIQSTLWLFPSSFLAALYIQYVSMVNLKRAII